MYKEHQIILLPTDKKTDLCICNKLLTYLPLHQNILVGVKNYPISYQHLYVLSDETIKEGDYIMSMNNEVHRVGKFNSKAGFDVHSITPLKSDIDGSTYTFIGTNYTQYSKKIIATTDKSLTIDEVLSVGKWSKDNKSIPQVKLPQLPTSFIQYYIEQYNIGVKLDKIMVEMVEDNFKDCNCYYDKFCKSTQLEEGLRCKSIEPKNYKLKLNSNNEINIKTITKSYNKEELLGVFLQCNHDLRLMKAQDIRNWIQTNL